MIYCTRNIPQAKYNKHIITFHSLKNYSTDIYKEVQGRVLFLNYENFHEPEPAYKWFYGHA